MLGGGTAGLVSSLIAAGAGARVALIERERTVRTRTATSVSLVQIRSIVVRYPDGRTTREPFTTRYDLPAEQG